MDLSETFTLHLKHNPQIIASSVAGTGGTLDTFQNEAPVLQGQSFRRRGRADDS